MRRRIILGIAFFVVLGIGIGIGGSGKNKTAGSTKTVTSIRTVTVARTAASRAPVSCRKAISSARQVGLVAAIAFDTASKWPNLLSKLATAVQDGSVSEVNAVTASATNLDNQTTTETPLLRAAVADFNRYAAACK